MIPTTPSAPGIRSESGCPPPTPGPQPRRAGAHRQAADFYRIAMESGARPVGGRRSELLELVAEQYYLIDQLDEAIDACGRALCCASKLVWRRPQREPPPMAVYEWYNANREAADTHAAQQ